MKALSRLAYAALDRGRVPDTLIRAGIRRLCRDRLRELAAFERQRPESMTRFLKALDDAPVAPLVEKANEQHYEVPAAFFAEVLGPHLKYSSAFWQDVDNLGEAEAQGLRLSCEHAALEDGQDILELGCGWGSLTLWMAKHYPNARITAVSNSASQRAYIEAQARERNLHNLKVITADINHLVMDQQFDRIVSVEMFEHLRNYRTIFARVSGWLRPKGRFFMHIFCHKTTPYFFEDRDDSDWMSRHFFSGGMMPSVDLPLGYPQSLQLAARWDWSGVEYQKTAEAWLQNLDAQRQEVKKIFSDTYGPKQSQMWINRWRVFFMACAELFGMDEGSQWQVSHYLFDRK
ncbi:MAG: cyclopropane-fatty-acyl-phospholipid synthase family protein [Gammaproteobacteria bacterium]